MIPNEVFPIDSAASTYCKLRMDNAEPRTIRAVVGAMMTPIAKLRRRKDRKLYPFEVLKMARMKMASTSGGNPRTTSIARLTTRSVLPRK